jgi:hypothetical protein
LGTLGGALLPVGDSLLGLLSKATRKHRPAREQQGDCRAETKPG